mgnify:CR=1 FL=1
MPAVWAYVPTPLNRTTAEDVAVRLAFSREVVVVPGYGMALAQCQHQVRELAAWSETVREEERTRIAREVHDELGSLLVALKMDVNWMDKRLAEQTQRSPDAAEDMRSRMRCKCQNMSRLIENAVDNVGRIITDLRPSILDHQGLWAALEWQAQEFVAAAELRPHVVAGRQLERGELGPVELAVGADDPTRGSAPSAGSGVRLGQRGVRERQRLGETQLLREGTEQLAVAVMGWGGTKWTISPSAAAWRCWPATSTSAGSPSAAR